MKIATWILAFLLSVAILRLGDQFPLPLGEGQGEGAPAHPAALSRATESTPPPLVAQAPPPTEEAAAEVASYQIQARLDPVAKQIHGSGQIIYRNVSPEPLREIWLRLYLNAFRSPETLWLRESGPEHRGQRYDPSQPGWIRLERLALAETGLELAPAEGDADQTIVRVPLSEPLAPDGTLRLEVRWTAQLPRVSARTGFAGDFVLAGQWYPKLAVYDRGGWDTEPWHANAEFFADFGVYDLDLTVPQDYVTGASGTRLGESIHGDGTKTVRYRAERVTDVAWTAWPGFRVESRAIMAVGRPLELELLIPLDETDEAGLYLTTAEAALDMFGTWYGPYPWPKLTLVLPPTGAEGAAGMEYPTFATAERSLDLPLGLGRGIRQAEVVTVHEIAHQWFPMQVQNNEAAEPWLDESFADYLTIRFLNRWIGPERSLIDLPVGRLGYAEVHRLSFVAAAARRPLDQPAWQLPDLLTYAATVYSKGSLGLLTLERTLGEERFTTAVRSYAERWRWRHPTTADLRTALEEATGEPLDWFFDAFAHGTEVVDYRVAGVTGADPRQAAIERVGEAGVPVEIRLTFADGTERRERWAGRTGRLELDGEGRRIVAVAVDPDERIALELNRLNNVWVASTDPAGPVAVTNRWLFFTQLLLQLGEQIG